MQPTEVRMVRHLWFWSPIEEGPIPAQSMNLQNPIEAVTRPQRKVYFVQSVVSSEARSNPRIPIVQHSPTFVRGDLQTR
jgi:hypothetical protein